MYIYIYIYIYIYRDIDFLCDCFLTIFILIDKSWNQTNWNKNSAKWIEYKLISLLNCLKLYEKLEREREKER